MTEEFELKDFYDGIDFTTHTRNVSFLCGYTTFETPEQEGIVRSYEYRAYKTDKGDILLNIQVPLLYPEYIGFQENICPACAKDIISIVSEVKKKTNDSIHIQDVLDQLVRDKVLKLLPYSQTAEFFKILSPFLEEKA